MSRHLILLIVAIVASREIYSIGLVHLESRRRRIIIIPTTISDVYWRSATTTIIVITRLSKLR
jgi:hypothetical protein